MKTWINTSIKANFAATLCSFVLLQHIQVIITCLTYIEERSSCCTFGRIMSIDTLGCNMDWGFLMQSECYTVRRNGCLCKIISRLSWYRPKQDTCNTVLHTVQQYCTYVQHVPNNAGSHCKQSHCNNDWNGCHLARARPKPKASQLKHFIRTPANQNASPCCSQS